MTTPTAVTGLPRPRVVLVGPPGAGKSTIGRRLSHALSCELVDSDHLIEQAKNKPCGEVFSEQVNLTFARSKPSTLLRHCALVE